MTMMDNGDGFGPQCGVSTEDINEDNYGTKIYDNWISGEIHEITDCPDDGSYCVLTEKAGLALTGCALDGRGPMPTGTSSYPISKTMGPGGVAKQTIILERNEFHNFYNETNLGMA
jgi:hypothetical protein